MTSVYASYAANGGGGGGGDVLYIGQPVSSGTSGSLLYVNSSIQLAQLAIGTANQVLIGGASVPTYSSSLALTGTIHSSGFLKSDTSLLLYNVVSGNYVTIEAGASTSAYNFVLPPTGGTSSYVLATDGTGTTSWVGFSDLSPLTTNGDILIYDSGNTRLPIGTNGYLLTVSGGLPTWAAAPASGTAFLYLASNTSVYGGTFSTLAFTGADNTVVGVGAGADLTTGAGNTFYGNGAGADVVSASDNTLIGYGAGSGVTGPDNICVGVSAGAGIAGGGYNVCIGDLTGGILMGAGANVFVGYGAGYQIDAEVQDNTIIGYEAGAAITGGSNTIVGYGAGAAAGSGGVFIGYSAGSAETGNNKLYIANSNTSTPLIKGDFSAQTVTINGTLSLTTALAAGQGGTGVTSVTTSPTATAFAGWDANSNLSANNFITGYATTATSGATTTLTVASAGFQRFTGSSNQTVVLPSLTTIPLGTTFIIRSDSSGTVTVQAHTTSTEATLNQHTQVTFTSTATTDSGSAGWVNAPIAGVLTSGEVVIGEGSGNPVQTLAAGSDGQVLARVSGSPAWTTTTGGLTMNGTCTIGAASTTPTHVLNTNETTGSGHTTLWTNVPGSSPSAPTGFIEITINGTTSYIPYFQ